VNCALALLSLCESQLHFTKGGNKMATNKKPANQLRCGNIKPTIWENTSEKLILLNYPFVCTIRQPLLDVTVE
jgi:hypothetical protein